MPNIAGIFEIGDSGEQFVIAEWKPDPKVIEADLMKLAADTENWQEPLAAAREAFIYSTQTYFETESDPYGRPWTALELVYLRSKLAAGDPPNILHRSGSLESAATSEEAWIITERDILFNTEAIPFYGPYHQAGTLDGDTSEIMHELRTAIATGKTNILIERQQGIGHGRGKALPQRQFVGANEGTIAEVEEIFLAWLNGLVDADWPAGRGAMITGIPAIGGGVLLRGAGGQFVGAIRP